jgi:uncharacterized membrane protein HdeD (DUF308 family)
MARNILDYEPAPKAPRRHWSVNVLIWIARQSLYTIAFLSFVIGLFTVSMIVYVAGGGHVAISLVAFGYLLAVCFGIDGVYEMLARRRRRRNRGNSH